MIALSVPSRPSTVIPAEAGIHRSGDEAVDGWVPAFAGTTVM
jgi:hypothetical protein